MTERRSPGTAARETSPAIPDDRLAEYVALLARKFNTNEARR
jgi:hypothetical protein